MPAEGLSGLATLIPLILMIAIFYFILIRPQKKKEKKLREMINALKVGDEVASIGGIHGKITRVKDELFILESGVGTTKSYITIEKSAISRLIKEADSSEKQITPLIDDEEESVKEQDNK